MKSQLKLLKSARKNLGIEIFLDPALLNLDRFGAAPRRGKLRWRISLASFANCGLDFRLVNRVSILFYIFFFMGWNLSGLDIVESLA